MVNKYTFYNELPAATSLRTAFSPDSLRPLPEGWHVVCTDVKGSTDAVEQGRYRNVMLLGASTIVCLSNLNFDFEFPFAFGGDGAICCLPEAKVPEALGALEQLSSLATERYGLGLRYGATPVGELRALDVDVLVGKYRISPENCVTVFAGGGVEHAEGLLKSNDQQQLSIAILPASKLDFSGLECRWRPIQGKDEKFLSLLVKPLSSEFEAQNRMYTNLIDTVTRIYRKRWRSGPITKQDLSLTLNAQHLQGETLIRHSSSSRFSQMYYLCTLRFKILLGKFLMERGIAIDGFNWGTYKDLLVRNIDHRGFTDSYYQIIRGSNEQHATLREYLEEEFRKRFLVYGTHHSDHAIFTCYITTYSEKHLHFLDGGNGGYTFAARNLKSRLRSLEGN